MAYVNKAYQYHSHATVPVVIQQQQKQQQQQQLALQQSRASAQQPQSRVQSQSYSYQPQNAIRHVPVVYPSGRVYYSPQSALATGSRSSTMGARSNSTQSQSTTTRQSQSLGGSKASVVSKRSGKSSIQQEYHDKKVRGLLLAPYFGRGRVPYLIAIGLTVGGILFIIGAGVVFGLRFHNNIMLTIDKGEIFGPVLIVVGLVLLAGAMKFYFDAYSVSNKERRKVQYSAARDNMVRISVIDVNRRQPGEAIVSGTSTNEAVTRTPHRAAAMVSRPLNADRHSTSGRNQRSYASDKRDSEMMPRSGSGTPLSYLAARRQPIEEPIDNRNSATVREDVQAGQAHEIYSNSSIRPAAAPAPRGSTATSQRASAVPQSASAVPPPRASAVSQSASAVPPPRASAVSQSASAVPPPRASAVSQSASAVPPPRASAVSQSASAVPPPRASASATSAVPSPRASSTTSPRASAVPSSRDPATRPRRASAASLPKASAVPQQVAVQSSASRPSTNPNTRAPAPSMANAAVPSSKVATTASSFAVRQLGRQSRTTTEV